MQWWSRNNTSMAVSDCVIDTVYKQNLKLVLKFSCWTEDVSYVPAKSISVFVHWRTFPHHTCVYWKLNWIWKDWTRIDFQTICDVTNHAPPLKIRFSENWAMNVKHIDCQYLLKRSSVYCLMFDYYVSFFCLRLMLIKPCRRLVSPFLWAPFGEGWMHRREVVFCPNWLTWWSETVSI